MWLSKEIHFEKKKLYMFQNANVFKLMCKNIQNQFKALDM